MSYRSDFIDHFLQTAHGLPTTGGPEGRLILPREQAVNVANEISHLRAELQLAQAVNKSLKEALVEALKTALLEMAKPK